MINSFDLKSCVPQCLSDVSLMAVFCNIHYSFQFFSPINSWFNFDWPQYPYCWIYKVLINLVCFNLSDPLIMFMRRIFNKWLIIPVCHLYNIDNFLLIQSLYMISHLFIKINLRQSQSLPNVTVSRISWQLFHWKND